MAESKENKELYMELKALDEEIKKLNTLLENVDEQLNELNSSKLILNKFSDLKSGDELRVPLTSGVYFMAKLTETKNLLVNVGAGVCVEKTPKDVLKIYDSQLLELSSYKENLIKNMKILIARFEKIQKKLD